MREFNFSCDMVINHAPFQIIVPQYRFFFTPPRLASFTGRLRKYQIHPYDFQTNPIHTTKKE
jgi:hypothetical protein